MKVSASELYDILVNQYGFKSQVGHIQFTIKDLTVSIEAKDSVGNLLQEWLKAWMKNMGVDFEENPNSQKFPDFYLNKKNKKIGLLEVKTFDMDRGPGFDLANFESYCNSLLESAYRLDSDYLVIGYRMKGANITIEEVWLKKIWELAGGSGTYPIKVQEKKNIIYNLRPVTWYSTKAKFKPFANKEAFLKALNETRYRYPKTHHNNAHWLQKVLKDYKRHTGVTLTIL